MNKFFPVLFFGCSLLALDAVASSGKPSSGTSDDDGQQPQARAIQYQNADGSVTNVDVPFDMSLQNVVSYIAQADKVMTESQLYKNGGWVMLALANLLPQDASNGSVKAKRDAKQYNGKLNGDNSAFTGRFLEALTVQGLGKADLEKEFGYVSGFRQMQLEYFKSMKNLLLYEINELKQGRRIQGGFAVQYVPAEKFEERSAFLRQAESALNLDVETNDEYIDQWLRQKPTFYSFIKVYLSLVRDVSGTLLTRQATVDFRCKDQSSAAAQRKVFSLHSLPII